MSEADAKPTRRKWWKYLLVLCLLGLVGFGVAAWYMTTDSFQAYVRARIVAEIEKATGGRVELGTYHTIPFRLQAEIRGLTIHGTESADDVPLLHADRVVARIRIIDGRIGWAAPTDPSRWALPTLCFVRPALRRNSGP